MPREQASRKRKPILRVSIVDQVCEAIKKDIADGVWKEGEKIPSEGEFAELFGVNRLSVRMALQKLNTLGIIETRIGEGSYVTKFSFQPILQEITFLYEGEERYEEVRHLRFLLETECMRLALDSTDEEKEMLHKALLNYDKCEAAFYADSENEALLEALTDADFQFHKQIIKMSHNRLISDIYQMVQTLIRKHIKQLLVRRIGARKKQGRTQIALANNLHAKIYEAILHADGDSIRTLSEEMLGIVDVPDVDIFD